ncbi:MAG: hypothetical protein Kow0056_09890 [Coriobacteriia bacterium]
MSAREAIRAANIAYFVHAESATFHGKVLDVGCGAKPYRKLFPMLQWVGLDKRPVAEIQADFHEIPEADDSYDTVFCSDALQFAEDPFKVVQEMARVLRPGGALLLIAPSTDVESGEAYWGFRIEGLRLLCERAGLEVLRVARVDHPNGGIILGAAMDFNEAERGGVALGGKAMGWAKKMDELMPTMVAAVATKPKVSATGKDTTEVDGSSVAGVDEEAKERKPE